MVPKSSYDIVILGTRREKSKVAKIQVDFVLSYQEEKGLNGLSVFSHIKKKDYQLLSLSHEQHLVF